MTTNPLIAAELAIILAPLNSFLSDLQKPGANTEAAMQDFGKLQLQLLQNAPGMESVGINQIAAQLQQKLNSLVASQTASATTTA